MKVNILREIPWFGGNTFHPTYFDDTVFRLEGKLLAGKSTPPHYHKHFDEHWTIKKGTLTFVVGKERFTKKPGETFFCPKNIVHELRNDTAEDIIVITEMRPAADMAKMMAIIAGLHDDKEKYWMFKYLYVEKRAELKEFSTPVSIPIKLIAAFLLPITMMIGRFSGWDRLLNKYF